MKDAYAKAQAARLGLSLARDLSLDDLQRRARVLAAVSRTIRPTASWRRLTVQIGTGLHYNPLTNHDAAVWWVREAADWVMQASERPATDRRRRKGLLQRVNSEDDPAALARLADDDALRKRAGLSGRRRRAADRVEAELARVAAHRRPAWRSLALARAAAAELSGRAPADDVGATSLCSRSATCIDRSAAITQGRRRRTRRRFSHGSRRSIRSA